MPVTRRHPSMDLRSAADQAPEMVVETHHYFPQVNKGHHHHLHHHHHARLSTIDMHFPATPKLSIKQSIPNLRLMSKTPNLHQRYESDEEATSPSSLDDFADSNDDDASSLCCGDADDDDDDAHVRIIDPFATAVAVSITAVGPPRIIDLAALAPIKRRTQPVPSNRAVPRGLGRPEQRKRLSLSAAAKIFPPRASSRPTHVLRKAHAVADSVSTIGTCASARSSIFSAASTAPSSIADDDDDEANLLLRESEDIQAAAADRAYAGTPTYATYAAHDPFGLDPPRPTAPRHKRGAEGRCAMDGQRRPPPSESRAAAPDDGGRWGGLKEKMGMVRRKTRGRAAPSCE